MKGFVAVHVGAGYHAESLRPQYKTACKDACKAAVQLLNTQHNAVEAVTAAVSQLEDCALTNAGIGSNLTLKGNVECDAGIMDGQSLNFGSVGALSNIKNPIKVAKSILEVQNKGLLTCGRIPPSTLVGEGALEWALEKGLKKVDQRKLTTKISRGIYLKNVSLLQNTHNSVSKHSLTEEPSCDESTLLDTVGAVCVDAFGNISSAVSSGGILLKHSGRIGQAAIYGSGCWAENSLSSDKPSIACSVTGVGEYLVKTMFAKECSSMLSNDYDSIFALRDIFKKCFVESPYLKNITTKLAGTLAVKHYLHEKYCELSWVHTTKTMILGYMSESDVKPHTIISVQPPEAICGESIFGSEKRIKLL